MFLCIVALNLSVTAQSFKNIEMNVKCVYFPTKPLASSVKTFSIDLDEGSVDLTKAGINSSSIYSYMRLNGYTFVKKNGDVTLKVKFSEMHIPDYQPEKEEDNLHYYANYSPISAPIEIEIVDKAGAVVAKETIVNEVSVRYPEKFGNIATTSPNNYSEKDLVEVTMNIKAKDKVEKDAINAIMSGLNSKINRMFAFIPVVRKAVIIDLKTKKDEDFTAWNEQAKNLSTALNHVTTGASPAEFEKETKACSDFWKAEIEKYKADTKKNKNLLGAASHNLEVIATYSNHFDESTALFKEYKPLRWKYDEEDAYLNKFTTEWSQSMGSSMDKADYKAASQILPLAANHSEAKLTLSDGKILEGVVILHDRFYVQPYQSNYGVSFVTRADYLASLGAVNKSNTHQYKIPEVKEYTIAEKTFKYITYKNTKELTIGKQDVLAEEFVKGNACIYLMFNIPDNAPKGAGDFAFGLLADAAGAKTVHISEQDSRINPCVFISIDNGIPTTILNSKGLAETFKKNTEIAEKIKKGEYGNQPVSEKTGLMAKMGNALNQQISLETYARIVNDYNASVK